MPVPYSIEVHKFVRENCAAKTDAELATACNEKFGTHFTGNSMQSFRHSYRYIGCRMKKRPEKSWYDNNNWPEGMIDYIRDHVKNTQITRLVRDVNSNYGTDFTRPIMLQFCKERDLGHLKRNSDPTPAISQKKNSRYRAANACPVGTIRKCGRYIIRKKQMNGNMWERWERLHRAVWEENNGPIPDGMRVSFKDNNPGNCSIENLMLVTKSENAALTRRGYYSKNPELTEVALSIVRLDNAIKKKREKGKNDE